MSLNEKELQALAYFSVGVSSEGSIAGRDVSNRLSLAGEWGDTMSPVENSGISIGTLQKDLGQDRQATAKALVAAYQAWARGQVREDELSSAEERSAINDLSRNGKTIKDQQGRPLDPNLRTRLNNFLKSDEGRDFVHHRDVQEVSSIHRQIQSVLVDSPLYRHASKGDKIKLMAIVSKAFNQNRRVASELMRAMGAGDAHGHVVRSVEDALAYHFNKNMISGRDLALKGADIHARLHAAPAGHPLRQAWEEVLKDPLIRPSRIGKDPDRPDLPAQYTVIKNLFLDPTNSARFLRAIEQGEAHRFGRAHASGDQKATAGYFASGSDFVQWNADGKGVAYVGGQWTHIDRDDIALQTHPDGTVELALERDGVSAPLLRVGAPSEARVRTLVRGMHGDDVHALQSNLARLGYTDAHGRTLHSDGDFGDGTVAAVQAFQRDHALGVDGRAGTDTMEAIDRAVAGITPAIPAPDLSYLQQGREVDRASVYRDFAPAPTPGLIVPDDGSELDTQAMRTLQQQLNRLGMTDMQREALVTDGVHGPRTQSALARFQHSQGLPVTGMPDDTTRSMLEGRAFIAELARASAQAETLAEQVAKPATDLAPSQFLASPRKPVDPSDPGHPDHALNREIREGVQSLYASERMALSSGDLDNVTAALMADARAYGVDRVHLMEFGEGGRNAEDARIIVYSREPDDVHCNECSVDARQAMTVPFEQSYEAFEQVKREQLSQDLAFEPQRSLSQQQGRGMTLH